MQNWGSSGSGHREEISCVTTHPPLTRSPFPHKGRRRSANTTGDGRGVHTRSISITTPHHPLCGSFSPRRSLGEPFIFTRHPERSRLRRSRKIYCRKRRSYGCGRILPEAGFRRFASITNIYIVGADSISALLIEYFGSIWNAPLR